MVERNKRKDKKWNMEGKPENRNKKNNRKMRKHGKGKKVHRKRHYKKQENVIKWKTEEGKPENRNEKIKKILFFWKRGKNIESQSDRVIPGHYKIYDPGFLRPRLMRNNCQRKGGLFYLSEENGKTKYIN